MANTSATPFFLSRQLSPLGFIGIRPVPGVTCLGSSLLLTPMPLMGDPYADPYACPIACLAISLSVFGDATIKVFALLCSFCPHNGVIQFCCFSVRFCAPSIGRNRNDRCCLRAISPFSEREQRHQKIEHNL